MPTEWRPVVGHEGVYDVSADGQVWSRIRHRPLVGGLDHGGHRHVTLARPRRVAWVHHLVLEAFVGPRPSPKAEGAHWDGDPSNNRPGNLRWTDRFGNAADKTRHGTHNNTVRRTCRRLGHELVEPNLVRWHLARGGRACEACHWAGAIVSRAKGNGRVYSPSDRNALAQEMYEHLMAGDRDPRERNLTGKLAS